MRYVNSGEFLGAEEGNWASRSKCSESDPDAPYVKSNHLQRKFARDICGACAVLYECRIFALQRREPLGVWGGLTTYERSAIYRKGTTTNEIERARFAIGRRVRRG